MTSTPQSFASTVRAFLNRDHARIEGLGDRLLDELTTGRATALALWHRFDAAVRGHMEVEEHQLLRPYADAHPEEAAALRADHGRLRRALDGLKVELTASRLREFTTSLTAHARREDSLLYAWAERGVDPATQTAIARELTERDRHAALDDVP